MTDNIVFICKYYKPSDKYNSKQEDKIRKREFLSCNGSITMSVMLTQEV